jgi:hypothetical protein
MAAATVFLLNDLHRQRQIAERRVDEGGENCSTPDKQQRSSLRIEYTQPNVPYDAFA